MRAFWIIHGMNPLIKNLRYHFRPFDSKFPDPLIHYLKKKRY